MLESVKLFYLYKEMLLELNFTKFYSFTYILNGVAIRQTTHQEENFKVVKLAEHPSMVHVQKSYKVLVATVHTPKYVGLNLPLGIWSQMGGVLGAGKNVIIGIVDIGINPTHPSFVTTGEKLYGPLPKF